MALKICFGNQVAISVSTRFFALSSTIAVGILWVSPAYSSGTFQCEVDGLGFCGDKVETIIQQGKCRIDGGSSFDCSASILFYTWNGKPRGSYITKIQKKDSDEIWNTDLGIRNKTDSGCAQGPAIPGQWNRKFSISTLRDIEKLPRGNVTDKEGKIIQVSTLFFSLPDIPCRGFQVN